MKIILLAMLDERRNASAVAFEHDGLMAKTRARSSPLAVECRMRSDTVGANCKDAIPRRWLVKASGSAVFVVSSFGCRVVKEASKRLDPFSLLHASTHNALLRSYSALSSLHSAELGLQILLHIRLVTHRRWRTFARSLGEHKTRCSLRSSNSISQSDLGQPAARMMSRLPCTPPAVLDVAVLGALPGRKHSIGRDDPTSRAGRIDHPI